MATGAHTMSKGALRRQRAESAARYAPRMRAAPPAPAANPFLRRLTAEVLDELKLPGSVPSRVIYAALARVAAR